MLKSSRSARVLLPVMVLAAVALSACSFSTKPAATPSPTPVANDQAMMPPADGATLPVSSPGLDQTTALTSAETTAGTVYTQTLFYMNPAGGDNVGFTLTVDEAGTIVDADTEIKAHNQTSVGLQNNFKTELKAAVVGKKVAGLEVDRIGGASLTTGAFRDFLADVESQS